LRCRATPSNLQEVLRVECAVTRVVATIVMLTVALVAPVDAAPLRTVKGVVVRTGSGTPVADASVFGERGEVALTAADGTFTIRVARGGRELTVVAPGFETRTVRIVDGDNRIELDPASGSEIIEVTGKAPEETKPVSYQLTVDEIRGIPGAGNDILRAATVLPGVARIPYSFGGLVLRGMSPRDTAIYLDGIEVPIAFHFGGITSFYPSAMLSDLAITAGGFDASYGRASGGIVTLTTREPRTDHWRFGGTIGIFDSSFQAEGPWRGGGVIVGIRRSYLDAVVRPFVDKTTPLPSYYDFQLRMSWGDPGGRGRITPMLFASIDRVASDDTAVTSAFVRVAALYQLQRGATTLSVVPWAGTNRLSFSADNEDGPDESFARPLYPGGVRAEVLHDYRWGHLRGGAEVESGYLAPTEISGGGDDEDFGTSTIAWTDFALWGEARYKLDGDRFAVKPGLRLEAYGLTGELVVDPRLNLHQQIWPGVTLRQAIGRFHEPPVPGEIDPEAGNPDLNSSYTDQVSLGVDTELPRAITASVTGYFNDGHDLGVKVGDNVEPNLGGLGPTFELLLEKQLGIATYRENRGRARTYGVEVLLKRNVGRLFSLLSYTLARSQRTDDPHTTIGWRPFELDQRHNLQLASSVVVGKWRFGARFQLVTGNPYTHEYGETGPPVPFGARLPPFISLDLRADKLWHRHHGDLVLFLDVQNATNHHNVEGRESDYDELGNMIEVDIPGLPILPILGVEYRPR
jgi:hypothetical protein